MLKQNVFPRESHGSNTDFRVATCLPHCPDACWSRIPTNIPTSKSRNFDTTSWRGLLGGVRLPGLGDVANLRSPLFFSAMKRIFGRGTLPYLGDLLTRAINWDDPPSTPPNRKPEVVFFFFLVFSLFLLYMGGFSNYLCLPGRGTYSAHASITAGPSHNSGCP